MILKRFSCIPAILLCAPRQWILWRIHTNCPSIYYILHDILHDILQTWFPIRSLPWKEAKIHNIWHNFMKYYEFWWTKKCPGKEFMSKFIYEFMENHLFIYEIMKKNIWFRVYQEVYCPRILIWIHIWIHIHTCEYYSEFIFEFIYENIFNEFVYELINELTNELIYVNT